MISWATVVTALAAWLCGLWIIAVLRPSRRRSELERHASALLAGMALFTIVYPSLVAVLGPVSIDAGRIGIAALAAPGLLCLRSSRKLPLEPEHPRQPLGIIGALGLVLLLGFCAFAAFYPATMPMHVFDPVYHFAYKGKLIFHEGFGTEAWTDLDGKIGRVMTHPNYAPGFASLGALVGLVGGRFDEDAFKALCSVFVLVPTVWLWIALRPRGRAAAFSAALAWVSLPILYYHKLPNNADRWESVYAFLFGTHSAKETFPNSGFGPADGQVLDGGADLPLAAFVFGAFVHLWRCLRGNGLNSDRADVGLAGIFLGAAIWTKNEGGALCAVLALAFGISALCQWLWRRQRAGDSEGGPKIWAALPIVLVVALLSASTWFSIRAGIPSIDENYPERLTVAGLSEHSDRIFAVAYAREDSAQFLTRLPGFHVAEEMGVIQVYLETFGHVLRWNLIWPLFFAAVLWSLIKPRRFLADPASCAALMVLGACALYALILTVTPWNLTVLHLTVIPGRLILHVVPIAILASIAMLWPAAAKANGTEAERVEDARAIGQKPELESPAGEPETPAAEVQGEQA